MSRGLVPSARSPSRRGTRAVRRCPSALPKNLMSFERDRSVRMSGDDARRVVTCGTSCGYLARIDLRASGIRTGLAWCHSFENRSAFLNWACVEFDPQFIRTEVTHENLDLEEMPAVASLDVYHAKAHRLPMPSDIQLPLEETDAKRTVPRCTLAVTPSRGKIVILRIFADGTAGGKLWSEPGHTLADAP